MTRERTLGCIHYPGLLSCPELLSLSWAALAQWHTRWGQWKGKWKGSVPFHPKPFSLTAGPVRRTGSIWRALTRHANARGIMRIRSSMRSAPRRYAYLTQSPKRARVLLAIMLQAAAHRPPRTQSASDDNSARVSQSHAGWATGLWIRQCGCALCEVGCSSTHRSFLMQIYRSTAARA